MPPVAQMAGRLSETVMNSDLDIPHNRVSLSKGLLAEEGGSTEYVRKMTHELRTPLNVIIGLCQCLERDRDSPLSEKQRDTVVRMGRNAHALLDSVNRLLASMRTGKYQ